MENYTTDFFPDFFLIILQIFGLISYRKSRKKIFKMSDPLYIYSTILVSILAHLRIEYCYFMKVKIDDFFTFIFVILHSVGNHAVVILEFFIILIKNPKLCSMAVKIIKLRENLKRGESKKIITGMTTKWIFSLCFFQFFLYLHSSVVKKMSVLGDCNWFFSTYNFYSLAIDILIFFYIGNVGAIFYDINNEITYVKKNNDKIKHLKKILIYHREALNIVDDFNDCFGSVLLISAFKEFVVFVCTPFYGVVNPSKFLGVQEYIVWFLRYFLNYITKLLFIIITYKQVRLIIYLLILLLY